MTYNVFLQEFGSDNPTTTSNDTYTIPEAFSHIENYKKTS